MNCNNKDDREKYLENYFTEEGIKALEGRLKSLTELYIKNTVYPFKANMVGFPLLKIFTKEHHQGMIDELSQIIGVMNINIINGGNKNDN